METPFGATQYEYDLMDRIVRVVAHDGTATLYEYDANGNRTAVRHANGLVVTYEYDEVNRLVREKILDNNNTPMVEYTYTLGAAGERVKVEESGASSDHTFEYEYGTRYRIFKICKSINEVMVSIMKFYVFSPVILSKYVSAQDIILPDNIRYHTCEQCGADNQLIWDEFEPCFECETITSRRQLPDLMLYGGGIVNAFGRWFIVSKRFKDFFESNGFKGAKFYSAKLCFCRRNKYFDIQAPYFVMDITGRADYDFKGMNMEISMCRNCGMYHFDTPHVPSSYRRGTYPSLLIEKSWDGSDVFNQGECTEQFSRSVLESDLTGFEFLRFEQKFDKFENKQYIEGLSDLVDK